MTRDRMLQRFAEETDASADLGRAPDATERMDAIHAKHDAALARLQPPSAVRVRKVRKGEVKTVRI